MSVEKGNAKTLVTNEGAAILLFQLFHNEADGRPLALNRTRLDGATN